jgi:hypothetical protein
MEFEIMFTDLKEATQEHIATSLGYISIEECLKQTNWDVFPLIVLELDEE